VVPYSFASIRRLYGSTLGSVSKGSTSTLPVGESIGLCQKKHGLAAGVVVIVALKLLNPQDFVVLVEEAASVSRHGASWAATAAVKYSNIYRILRILVPQADGTGECPA
jgi:hypothetical protein